MIEKPEFVSNFKRPPKTEIKGIGGYWYLYEWSTRYDPVKKRNRKVSGKCLGKITADGLVPSNRRGSHGVFFAGAAAEAGLSLFFWRRTETLRLMLERHFPDIWKQLYVRAVVGAAYGSCSADLRLSYETCVFSRICPGVRFGSEATEQLISELETRIIAVGAFCKEYAKAESAFGFFSSLSEENAPEGNVLEPLGFKTPDPSGFLGQITEIAAYSGASAIADISFKTGVSPKVLRFCLERITAVQVRGKWQIVPVSPSVSEVLEKACLEVPVRDLAETLRKDSAKHKSAG